MAALAEAIGFNRAEQPPPPASCCCRLTAQPGVCCLTLPSHSNGRSYNKSVKNIKGKGGRRWYKNVGLGFKTPKEAIEGEDGRGEDGRWSLGGGQQHASTDVQRQRWLGPGLAAGAVQ